MIIETRRYPHGFEIGELPEPQELPGYTFTGWYTDRVDGTKITESWQVNESCTLYAHWEVNES